MKKILFSVTFILLLNSLYIFPSFSQSPTVNLPNSREEKIKEVKEQIKEKRQEIKKKVAKIINGEITGISGNTLTVKKDGTTYTVNIDSNTKIRRRFWGKGELLEYSAGDKVNVWGIWTDEANKTIMAKLIRNLSIQKRYGLFFGTIKSTGAGSFVVQTIVRGDQTVYFDSNTKFIDRKGTVINSSDIKTGDRVRIRGLWDKTLGKITEVKEIKDFSIPQKPTITP